jgi:hypothetical protein
MRLETDSAPLRLLVRTRRLVMACSVFRVDAITVVVTIVQH